MSTVTQSPEPAALRAIGEAMERARKAAGMSGREVAEAVGISPTYLRAIEQGSNPKTGRPSKPTAQTLLAIARILGLDPRDLLLRAGYSAELVDHKPSRNAMANRAVDDLIRQLQFSAKR